jgi:5-methylcytosine-specific restriction endonuclease McrA
MARPRYAQRLRDRLARKQGGLCFYCNRPMLLEKGHPEALNDPRQVTLDHILPKSEGGKIKGNSVAACLECNQERATQGAADFVQAKIAARSAITEN